MIRIILCVLPMVLLVPNNATAREGKSEFDDFALECVNACLTNTYILYQANPNSYELRTAYFFLSTATQLSSSAKTLDAANTDAADEESLVYAYSAYFLTYYAQIYLYQFYVQSTALSQNQEYAYYAYYFGYYAQLYLFYKSQGY